MRLGLATTVHDGVAPAGDANATTEPNVSTTATATATVVGPRRRRLRMLSPITDPALAGLGGVDCSTAGTTQPADRAPPRPLPVSMTFDAENRFHLPRR